WQNRARSLVTALAQDALAGNVAAVVVRVAGDPDGGRTGQLAHEAKGIIDDRLAAQGHQREVGTEADDLYRVGMVGPGMSGVVDRYGVVESLERSSHGSRVGAQGDLDGIGQRAAVLLGQFPSAHPWDDAGAPRIRILIGPAA